MDTLKIYLSLIAASLRARVEYKAAFIFYVFAIFIFYFGQLGLLLVILVKFKDINGWTIGEIAFLYGLLAVAQGFTAILFNALNDFEQMIVKGEFDRVLVRPLSPLWQIICSKFEISTYAHFIIGPAALYYGMRIVHIEWNLTKILFFPMVIFGAVLLQGGIRIIVASITFWVLRNSSLVRTVVYSSKEFISYPISIYNTGVQFFLTFIFPIAFVNYYPSHYFLEKSGTNLFNPYLQYLTPVAGLIVMAIAVCVWKTGINHYQSSGS